VSSTAFLKIPDYTTIIDFSSFWLDYAQYLVEGSKGSFMT
jgi:hypothetical protein